MHCEDDYGQMGMGLECRLGNFGPGQSRHRQIEEQHIDLVVMASQGLTGLEHLVLGSVAEKVVRQARCPVLVVKAKGKSLLPAPAD